MLIRCHPRRQTSLVPFLPLFRPWLQDGPRQSTLELLLCQSEHIQVTFEALLGLAAPCSHASRHAPVPTPHRHRFIPKDRSIMKRHHIFTWRQCLSRRSPCSASWPPRLRRNDFSTPSSAPNHDWSTSRTGDRSAACRSTSNSSDYSPQCCS